MFDVPPSTSVNKSTSESTNRSMTQTPINEKRRNYRFYAGDPAIHPADKRLYANGDFEGTPLHVSGGSDPRSINRTDRPYHDLPVPKFKLDRCWVGVIPAKEVTFRNLNDNITKIFLTDQCKRFGEIDDCRIYYDRQTKKHLGLGTVIFKSTKAARECVNALNMTTKMGSVISVSLETSGQERTKQYATIIRAQEQEKAAQEKALAASFAASPPPQPPPSSSAANDLNHHSSKQSDRSHLSSNHKITNNNNNSRTSKNSSSSSNRYDHRNNNNHHHHSTNDNNSEQFSFDPYGSFGINSKNSKPSRRSHHRSHHHHHRRDSQPKYRRKRKPSTSTTSSPSSRSSRSSSSSSSTTTSSHSSSTSRSYSRSSRSSSRSSRSSYSPTHSPNRKLTNDSRIKSNDDEDQRPSLDERIAALFQQNQTNNSSSSSIPSKGHHHKQIPLPNIPPPPSTHYPYPPQTPSALTNVVGSHHHHQQSYGVVNTFNFYGTSFPSASFLTSTGVTNWEDIFKQPPPSSSSTTITTTTTKTTINNNSTNGFRLYPNDSFDERQRKSNELTTTVTNVISNELIEILRKDLAKKLIETLVYKSIETWYDNEERKDKIRKIKSAENSTNEQTNSNEQSNTLHHSLSNSSIDKTADDIPSNQIATPQTAPPSLSTSSTNLSTYFEHMRDRTGSSVTTHIPKIPTFKKRPAPDEKPNPPPPPSSSSSQKTTVSIEKKEPEKSQQQRKISRKRLSSSSSESNITPENDDSQSRDSVSVPNEDISSSETKANNNKTISIDQPTPEEEEGEIKDDDETEDKSHPSEPVNLEPPSPPSEPIVKKTSTKTANKQTKKPGPPKKRKIEQIKSEPIQDQDDIDNSTLAKRKKSAINLHQTSIINELNTEQSTETVNLLDNLSQHTHSSPKTSYNPYAYIEFEHDYAIMTKQPVPVAKRLTVDGLHDMGVQIPIIMQPKPKFPPREHDVEMKIMYEIDQGIDEEDMSYLKQSFQKLCETGHSCTTKTRWVDHPPTRDLPFVKQPVEKHRTGCARTEGYYKIVKDEKIPLLKTADGSQNLSTLPQAMLDATRTTGAQMSRELRSEHRRNLLALGDAEFADHFKFSQLKLRKKRLRYAKSSIHAWGLFACEPIAMEDMVIEYVGETIRQSVGDLREKQYELEGINSNYMFRVDSDTIVDATKCGNLARFINHSCDPNCYAKIIPVESQKKIVIYSKRDIRLGEEITYDYKFPLEEQKIPCRCGTPTCRGSLN